MPRSILSLFFLLIPVTSFAAEEAHRGELADMTYRFINFAILFGALYFILSKPLRNYLGSRSDAIKKALDEARIAREEAEKRYRDYQEKMERLSAEAKLLRDSLIDEGGKEKERIIEEANKAAQRIREQARFTADQEIKKARLALKEEMANLIAEMAEERVKGEIKDSDQERLVKEYTGTLGGIH
jgi:F-type H+-transporting ATPase subunit b